MSRLTSGYYLGVSMSLLALPAAASDPLVLEATSVVDSRLDERADGPVQGYRATRSRTATRTDTDIGETPQSISVVPAQVLEDLNSTRIDRALDFAGGVGRQNNFGGLTLLNYSVRGFTTAELYKNGFAINRGSYSAPGTSSIERIEVLKGPAASLYGRGDPGGLVNIVTKRPQAEPFAVFKASAGSWDRYRSSVDLNGPLDEEGRVLSRVNLAVEDNGSFRDHVENRRQIIAPSLSWQLDDDTQVTLDAELSRTEAVFDRGLPAVAGRLGSIKRSAFFGEPNDGTIRNDNQTLDVALERYLDDTWTLRVANHYTQGHLRGDSSEASTLVGDVLSRFYRQRDFGWNDNITQAELHGQFDTPGLQHQMLIGLEYERYRNRQDYPQSAASVGYGLNIFDPVYGGPKPLLTRPNRFRERTESQALNLQDQITFDERWHAVLGVRLERVEQTAENRAQGSQFTQTKEVATPRLGLLYQWTPEVGVFANASTSFKPNSLGTQGQVYRPEKGVGYEAGIKLNLLEGRFGATVALFHIDKENVISTDAYGESVAAGKARSQGLDMQFSGQLTDSVRLIGAYAYIDAEVTQGDAGLPKGSDLLGIPRHSGSAMLVHSFQGGALQGADMGIAVNHVGERSGQAGGGLRLPAYTTVDLLAHYPLSDRVTLGVNLNNLFDRTYYERGYNAVWTLPGEPRNLMLSVSAAL